MIPWRSILAAQALSGRDTPRRIELSEQARSKAPEWAWANLSLAYIQATENWPTRGRRPWRSMRSSPRVRPRRTRPRNVALSRAGTPELQARVAAALRARLAAETEPKLLEEYATLWGVEFRAHPPQEHDAIRKQVAADLKRLESMNPKPDAEWFAFLKDGYKQSGASAETVTAMEERVIQAFPHS